MIPSPPSFDKQTTPPQALPSTDAVSPQETKLDREKQKFFDFTQAKTYLSQLIQDWRVEVEETEARRRLRRLEIMPERLREVGKLLPDETIVPMRVIDVNIRREQPAYINFLKGSNRLAILTCEDDPTMDTQRLEQDFSSGMMYNEWEIPHYRTLDGGQTHGWDAIEIEYDEDKPLQYALAHVGHDQLFFDLKSKHLQANDRIIRAHYYSPLQLKEAVGKFGFSQEQVDRILEKMETISRGSSKYPSSKITIYKVMFKWEGVVYVAWFDIETTDDWIKEPAPLYLGRKRKQLVQQPPTVDPMTMIPMQQPPIEQWVDALEYQYPIFLFIYVEGEEQTIVEHRGRVFLDKYDQEAQTAIASGYINGLNRASNVYGAVSQGDPGRVAAPKQLETKLVNGAIYDTPIQFFHTEYPDPNVLNGLNLLNVRKTQDSGQMDFAVANRKDSRKTATENQLAAQQAAALSSVQVSLYSAFLRNIYSFTWLLVQNRALQNKIKIAAIPQAQMDPMTGQQKVVWVNDEKLLSHKFQVKAAGDVDVIQRQEMLNKLRQDYAVIAQVSPELAKEILKTMLQISYPSYYPKWQPIIDSIGSGDKQLVAKLGAVLQQIVTPQILKQLPPKAQQNMQQLMQEVAASTKQQQPAQ